MKKLVYIFFVAVLFASCGQYNKVLNKGKNAERYKLAEELYKNEDYKRAIPLFEKLMGPYAGKPQMERIQYMVANSYFQSKDYSLASYYFTKFISNYAESSKVEEAAFLAARSYYMGAPKYSIDQQDTYQALTAFQDFIDSYPNSELAKEANSYYKELTIRLEKKDYEIAKQYYHTENYVAAIMAFDTFNEEHLGSTFKEDALYLKFKSTYELGVKSSIRRKEKRLNEAKSAYEKFERSFPESKKMKEMNNKLEHINKELVRTQERTKIILQNN